MLNLSVGQIHELLSSVFSEPVTSVQPLVGGHWSQAFGFRLGERHLVVRFGQYVDDFRRDQVASQFSTPDMPIPEVFEIGQAFEGYYCISQRMFGDMIDDLPPDRMERIVPAVFRLMDGLRDIDLDKWTSGLGIEPTPWKAQLLKVDQENERVHGWHDRLKESPLGSQAYSIAWRYLNDHLEACPEANALVHNDLFHQNVLVQDDGISGVLDWGNAIPGDFLYELALVTFYAPWFPSMNRIDWQAEARRHYQQINLHVPDMDARLRCYEMHIGLDGIAYNAFRRDTPALEAAAHRTLQLAAAH